MAPNVNPEIQREIERLYEYAKPYFENGDHSEAVFIYYQAFVLIPDPYEEYAISTSILGWIAQAYCFDRRFDYAIPVLKQCLRCKTAEDNPYIHFLLGMAHFELGDLEKAKSSFLRTYELSGMDIFDVELPEYFNLIRKIVKKK